MWEGPCEATTASSTNDAETAAQGTRRKWSGASALALGCVKKSVSAPVKKSGPKADSLGSSEKVGNACPGRPKRDIWDVAQQTIQEFSVC